MASAFKNKVSSVASSMTSSSTTKANTDSQGNDKRDAYRLRITAGPNYDKSLQRQVAVNKGTSYSVSEHCAVSIRIKDYSGLPSSSPATDDGYFSLPAHKKDTFSVSWSLTPPHDIPASDLVFGLDTGHNPLRKYGIPKTLVNTAFRIVKEFVDPSLGCDAGADEPWVRGPAVAGATTTMNFGPLAAGSADGHGRSEGQGGPAVGQGEGRGLAFPDPRLLVEGAVGDEAARYREQLGLTVDDAGKRRKALSSEGKRKDLVLQKGRTYYFDFSNGYIDWKEYALKLPGFSVPVLKWIGGGDKSGGATSAPTSPRPDSLASPGRHEGSSPRTSVESQPGAEGNAGGSGAQPAATNGGKEGNHKVRFFLKDIARGEEYFVVMCTLLSGEELVAALEEDRQAQGQPQQ